MRDPKVKKLTKCRVCRRTHLTKVLTLGPTPLANEFLSKTKVDLPEEYYPLDVYFCKDCTFLQLGHVVDPKILFGNYVYVSSTSQVFINHFKEFARVVKEKHNIPSKSLIIDLG